MFGSRSRFTKDFNPSCTTAGKATIANCFRKANILAENQVALEDSNDLFKVLQENLTELLQSSPDLFLD